MASNPRSTDTSQRLPSTLHQYPLLEALRNRRSRRFALGMRTEIGPLAFSSSSQPLPLSELEEATLAYAACGITGPATADLVYAEGQGGSMMAGLVGRTVGSPDAAQGVALAVVNDTGAWLVRRPDDFTPAQLRELIDLSRQGELLQLYRRGRVQIHEGRCSPPLTPPFNIDCNRWDLYAPGTTYFLPINDYTYLYINVLLEAFTPTMGLYLLDERAGFRPAGLKRFGKSRGGHLFDDPAAERTLTVERFETLVHSVLQIEQGMMLQNLGLMAQAMGVGGFPNFAGHEFGWFEALGFRMEEMSGLRYLGAGKILRWMASLLGKDRPVRFPVGLQREGETLLRGYCPPWFRSMEEAVLAVVQRKFGAEGVFGERVKASAWIDPERVGRAAGPPNQANLEAVVSYCEYIHRTYGRFPAYAAPFRTSVAFQAAHLDLEFYNRYYQPEIVSETHRQHIHQWHPAS